MRPVLSELVEEVEARVEALPELVEVDMPSGSVLLSEVSLESPELVLVLSPLPLPEVLVGVATGVGT